jgi:hypothetical protein
MSRGVPDLTSESIPAVIQLLYAALYDNPVNPVNRPVPEASFAHRTGALRISCSATRLRDAHAGPGTDPGAVRHAFGSCSAGVLAPRLHSRSAGVGLDVARSIAGKQTGWKDVALNILYRRYRQLCESMDNGIPNTDCWHASARSSHSALLTGPGCAPGSAAAAPNAPCESVRSRSRSPGPRTRVSVEPLSLMYDPLKSDRVAPWDNDRERNKKRNEI